jgi:hypothetical protein
MFLARLHFDCSSSGLHNSTKHLSKRSPRVSCCECTRSSAGLGAVLIESTDFFGFKEGGRILGRFLTGSRQISQVLER